MLALAVVVAVVADRKSAAAVASTCPDVCLFHVGKSTFNRPPTSDASRSLWATSDSDDLDATKSRLVTCDVLDWCLETSRAEKKKKKKKEESHGTK